MDCFESARQQRKRQTERRKKKLMEGKQNDKTSEFQTRIEESDIKI